jgi:tetraacyldisaccharide 4'-kinase
MLQMNLVEIPVIVDADRIRSGNRAICDYGADTVIFDDGFQQWKIKKDLEIVTIDATNPLGNRYLLPRGILRQPLSSLKRADVFVLTKTNINTDIEDIKDTLNKLNPSGIIIESIHQPQGFYNINKPDELFNAEVLKGKSVTLFSGIADPDSFENLIINLGIKIGLSFRFDDHHNYTRQDLDKIIKGSRDKNIDTIITTQKDAARLYELRLATLDLRLLVLRVQLAIKDEQKFSNRLLNLYSL